MTDKQNQTREVLEDENIIELYWDRNEKAIEETDYKYGKYLYTISYNILHNHLDSEECLNDTYLGAWNKIPPERPNVFKVFLTRVMRKLQTHLRRSRCKLKIFVFCGCRDGGAPR